jgi:hypothetical protein
MIKINYDTYSNLKNINQKGGSTLMIVLFIFLIVGGVAAYVLVIKPKLEEEDTDSNSAGGNPSDGSSADGSSNNDNNVDNKDVNTEPPTAFKVQCMENPPDGYKVLLDKMAGDYIKSDTNLGLKKDLPTYTNKNGEIYFASNTIKTQFDVCLADKVGNDCSGGKGRSAYINAVPNGDIPPEAKLQNWQRPWSCEVKY